MRKIRAALIAVALTAIVLAIAPAASGASAANVRCVGHPPCFATLQKAIDAAHDGGVILVEPGTYAGGVTIDKSVEVIGSGASRTIIKGGGPVLTIGKAFAQSEPKVTISKVKITGGRTTSSPLSKEFVDKKNVIALGGGIAIPPGKFIKAQERFTAGATVKVIGSVISGNRVGPSATVPFGPPCPGGPCPFAYAGGGGIDNWGALTLERTDVSHNRASGVASDATGGGIDSPQGSLNLSDGTITSNRAIVGVPNGRYAEGGGIFTGGGLSNDAPVAVQVRGGSIGDNEASLTSKLPYFVGDGKGSTIDMNANGGGAHFGGGSAISIANARINENKVGVDDPKGEPYAFDAAVLVGKDSKLDLSHSTIEDNRVRAKVGSSEHAGERRRVRHRWPAEERPRASDREPRAVHGQHHAGDERARRRPGLAWRDLQRQQDAPDAQRHKRQSRRGPQRPWLGGRLLRRHREQPCGLRGGGTPAAAARPDRGQPRQSHRDRRLRPRRRHLERIAADAGVHPRDRQHLARQPRPHCPGRRPVHHLPGDARPQPDRPQPSRPVLRVQVGIVSTKPRRRVLAVQDERREVTGKVVGKGS